MFRHDVMLPLVVLGVATAFLGVPVMTLLPVFAKDVYALGPAGYSYLAAIFGAGGVTGALVVAWMGNRERKGRRALIMQIVLGLSSLGFGLAASVWFAGALLFLRRRLGAVRFRLDHLAGSAARA